MAISFVQQGAGTAVNATSSFAISLAGAPGGPGRMLVLVVSNGGTTPHVTGVTQTGVTWTRYFRQSNSAIAHIDLWVGNITAGGVAAGATVATDTASAVNYEWNVSEWDGADATAAAHTAVGQNLASSTSPTTPATTITNAAVLLVGGVEFNSNRTVTAGPTGGFTALTGTARLQAAIRLPGATGTYQTGWTTSTATQGASLLVSLVPAAGGGGGGGRSQAVVAG